MKRIVLMMVLLTPVCLPAQNRYDVLINEIMADPAPPVGLPANEWIELKNNSASPVQLLNWRIGDASGPSGPMPNFTLQPDSFVIVCTGSALAAMSAWGTAISVTSFPSLDNDGDQLYIKASNGSMIHAIRYTTDWYANEVKKNGGWTLEMIDPSNPCSGLNNWKASENATGGTPGRKNSVDAPNNDTNGPQLKRAYTRDSLTIVLIYDEPVDSLLAATVSNYAITGGLTITSTATLPPLFNLVELKVSMPMIQNTVYIITAQNIKDCSGNLIGVAHTTKAGLPEDPETGEWIINEILFNPRDNARDFVELYNNSNKVLDASKLFIGNRNSSGITSSVSVLSPDPFLVFPGDHLVITEDAENLALHYLVKNPGNILAVSTLPSYPDTEGTVVALNFRGTITDEVTYKDDWHFKLIDNSEGVSLERIDPNGFSQDRANWHSAASTAGYGTPTYSNSQYRRLNAINAEVQLTPKLFSPDNDGRDDIVTLQYSVKEAGYMASVIIYDATGRPVRSLVRNNTLGLSGSWNWDGLDDKGLKLPVGVYIFLTEIFNLQGRVEKYKNPVVLARNLSGH